MVISYRPRPCALYIHKPTTPRAAVAPPVPYVRDMLGVLFVESEMDGKSGGWSFVVMDSLRSWR
jgi:hypothetical protein